MKKRLNKHFLREDTFKDSNTILVSLADWLDYNTKQKKGFSAEILIQQDEITILKVNFLNKDKSKYKDLINQNIDLVNVEVVPYARNNFINYSYRADDMKSV